MEFAMEMYIGGFDVAAFWDNNDGQVMPDGKATCANCNDNASQHMLLSTKDGHRFNPMHYGLELLARAQNQSMLQVGTSGFRLHGFASRDSTTNQVQVWLINKYDGAPQKIRLTIPLTGNKSIVPNSIVSVVDDAGPEVPGPEHWGMMTAPKQVTCTMGVCELELPPLSFSMLLHTAGN
jgi:hypothetical protein